MSIIYLNAQGLPSTLQTYAAGANVKADFTGVSPETKRLAKYLRKNKMRAVQKERPGDQYFDFHDYTELMSEEIRSHVKRRLEATCLTNWTLLLRQSPRLSFLYDHVVTERGLDADQLSRGKFERVQYEIRREVFRRYATDPRTLGEIEDFVFGRDSDQLRYGIPPKRNYYLELDD